ncbi:hypothetical protein P0D88_37620 [Paraburkholderia sp. RL18-103-BIB-C]|uniref:hypothetical protein n=1 Tax=unclassified Paraburkholderia TaxID=2615204 RepID=UPI0038BAF11D
MGRGVAKDVLIRKWIPVEWPLRASEALYQRKDISHCIIRDIQDASRAPFAANQASGEFAMIRYAVATDAIDERRALIPADADLIRTYVAMDTARDGI